MARLALGVAGAVIGGFFGGPQGASIGWSIGSLAGGLVDPQTTRSTGPRLDDLRVQASTYGNMIPLEYGSMRMAGNVIDASNKKEHSQTESSGKGGPSQETTTFTYTIDLAIGICEGPIGNIRRIWANGNLIYSIAEDADEATQAASASFASSLVIYKGDETQLPDPTMEALHGVGNVPAYRGLAYVVAADFSLTPYGNSVPNFEFEVLSDSDETTETETNYTSLLSVIEEFKYITSPIGDFPFPIYDSYDECLDNIVTLGPLIQAWNIATTGSSEFNPPYSLTIQPGLIALNEATHTHSIQYSAAPPVPAFGPGDQTVLGPEGHYVAVRLKTPPGNCDNVVDPCVTRTLTIFSGGGGDFCQACDGTLSKRITWVRQDITNGYVALQAPFSQFQANYRPGKDPIMLATDPRATDATFWNNAAIAAGMTERYPTIPQVTSYAAKSVSHANFTNPNDVDLADIVRDLCNRSSINSADIDVSQLVGIGVHGYAVATQMNARAALLQLQKAYFFDALESDYKIKFVRRGGASIRTIKYDDLGAVQYGNAAPDPISVTRAQEVDLPERVTITYANFQGDYQQATESAQRITTKSVQQSAESLSIALEPDEAASIAQVLMFDAYTGRNTYGFATTAANSALEPTDVVTVLGPGVSYLLRITKLSREGRLISFEAVAEDQAVYTADATGGTSQDNQTTVTVAPPTHAEYMDIPLLQDTDSGSGFYAALGGNVDAGWRGATLFRSPDDTQYVAAGSVNNSAIIGQCGTTLGNWVGSNFYDATNTLTVTIETGELTSITFDQMDQYGNSALVGNEIIQFKNATLQFGKTYILDTFLRGRKGTHQWLANHVAGERFVMLGVAGTLRPDEGVSNINSNRFYKPVTTTNRIADTVSTQFTNTGVGLKPYKPVHVYKFVAPSGDIILTWVRQTRIGQTWRDGVDASLGEASERYEVAVMSGGIEIRTLTALTPTATYTAAQLAADFPTGAPVFNIYQISADIGRGFPATIS